MTLISNLAFSINSSIFLFIGVAELGFTVVNSFLTSTSSSVRFISIFGLDEITYNFEKYLLDNISNFNNPKEIINYFRAKKITTENIATELPKATIPSSVKQKLDIAIDKIKQGL